MGLSANEKSRINKEYEKSITLYRCVDSYIRLFKSKVDCRLYKNHKADVTGLQELISALQDYKLYVEANVSKQDLGQIEIFRVENKVLMKRLNISDKKVLKMKKDIRDKFIPIYLEYKELIKRFL